MLLLAAEPFFVVLLAAIVKLTGATTLAGVLASPVRVAVSLPGILLGFLLIVALKFRKSPFDISTSHHAHQELVSGLTSSLAGATLASSRWHALVRDGDAVGLYCPLFSWDSPKPAGAVALFACRTGWRY